MKLTHFDRSKVIVIVIAAVISGAQ